MRWLKAAKGYIFKRNVWAAFKRLLGCACIFSLNNGTFGGKNLAGSEMVLLFNWMKIFCV
jgi:hypothetical protein